MPTAQIPAELSAHLQGLPAKADVRLASLNDWAGVRMMDDLIDKIGVENVILTVNVAFEAYVAPFINIPGMTPEQEREVAKFLLAMLIRGFHDLVHKKPGPMMAAMAPRTWVGESA